MASIPKDKLFEHALNHSDESALRTIFYTYPRFSTAPDLLNNLFSYYSFISSARIKVLKALSLWHQNDPEAFSNLEVLSLLSNWDALIQVSDENTTKKEIEIFRSQFGKNRERPGAEGPEYCSLKEVKKYEKLKFQDLIEKASEQYIAAQLTIVDYNLLVTLRMSDILEKEWEKNPENRLIPVFQYFSRVVHWIATEILTEITPKKRGSKLGTFIKIGENLLQMSNWNGVAKVYKALTLPCISRLQRSWKSLSTSEKNAWESICKVMEPDDTVRLLKSAKSICIPNFVSLMDLINKTNPENTNGTYNFAQLSAIAPALEALRNAQRRTYNITPDPRLSKYLTNECPFEYYFTLSKISSRYEPEDLEFQRFFFGKVNRGEAESILRGCDYDAFVITKNKFNVLELSQWNNNKRTITHTLLEAKENGFMLQGSTETFREIGDFVEFSKELYGHAPAWNSIAKEMRKKYKIGLDDDDYYVMKKAGNPFSLLIQLGDIISSEPSLPKVQCDSKTVEMVYSAIKTQEIPTMVLAIREGIPINTLFKNDNTLLHVAAEINCPRLVDWVMESEDQKKPDINARNANGFTALHMSCSKDGRLKVLGRLLKYGASVNIPNLSGVVPLHYLSKLISEDKVNYSLGLYVLIERGASVNCQDSNKDTPLHQACLGGNLEAVKFLLENQADTTLVNKSGQVPLNIAQHCGFKEIIDLLKRYPTGPQSLANAIALKINDFILDDGSPKVIYNDELNNLKYQTHIPFPYRTYFISKKGHSNVMAKTKKGILVVSYLKEQFSCRMLIRTAQGDTNILLPEVSNSSELIESMKFYMGGGEYYVYPLADVEPALQSFEKNIALVKPSFGIVYVAEGRYTEDKIFSTVQHSAVFEDFLNFLGKKVSLALTGEDHDKTKATEDSEYALSAKYNEISIVFHLSSSSPKDQRKTLPLSHGVVILFMDSTFVDIANFIDENYSSATIFFVIQPLKNGNDEVQYRMCICRKKNIPKFPPSLHSPAIFIRDDYFKFYLLTAILNADQLAVSPKKSKEVLKIREQRFDRFYLEFSKGDRFSGVGKELYKIGEKIGSGQTGVAYECKNRRTKARYCMKVVNKTTLEHEVLKRVIYEVELLAKLRNHKNIIRYYDKFEDEEELCIVLELCEGGSLKDDVKHHGRYSESQAATIILQLLEAIAAMHSEGICHRDLKPENILFKDKERTLAKIADFGLAKDLVNQSIQHSIAGTLDYVAPEVLEGIEYDYLKVDMWSLGCICFFLLYGHPPFAKFDNMQAFFHAVRRAAYTFDDSTAKISEEAKDFISQLLTVNYLQRLSATAAKKHIWVKTMAMAKPLKTSEEAKGTEETTYSFYF